LRVSISFFPTDIWRLVVLLVLFQMGVIAAILLRPGVPLPFSTHHLTHIGGVVAAILTVDSYFSMSHHEREFHAHRHEHEHAHRLRPDGYTLNEHRFREHRNLYLSFFALFLSFVIIFAERMSTQLRKAQMEKYEMKRADDTQRLAGQPR
jgi:hypothetical protein